MPLRSLSSVGRIVVCSLVAPAGGAYAQIPASCPGGIVSEVVIENHSVFDPATLADDGRLGWAYRLANAIHMRTREEFIAGELLFVEGGCPSPEDLEETARILREYQFIAQAEIFEVPIDDGTRRVVVNTRDEWTTKPALSLGFEDGVQFEGISLLEENLFGRGIAAGAYRVDRDARRETGMRLEIPAVAGSRADLQLRGSWTRVGGNFQQEVVVPFLAERPGTALRQWTARQRDFFTYVLPGGGEASHVVLPFVQERGELSLARRIETSNRLYVAGGGISYERIGLSPVEEAEAVRGNDFSDRTPVEDELQGPLLHQLTSRSAVRINAVAGLRNLTFDAREGLDAVAGVQDVPVGHQALVVLGRTVGDTGNRPGDLLPRIRYLFGHSGPTTVGQLQVRGEGRREDRTPTTPASFRDVLFEAHGLLYFVRDGTYLNNVLLRGAVHSGWRTTAPFQLTLGGPDGVRGYRDTGFPGGRRAVGSVEARLGSPNPFPELLDLGLTAFADIGAIWRGDAPYGENAGLHGALGGGVRIGFPAGTSTVIRADLAFPVGAGASARSPVFRIAAREWVGVLDPFQNPRMDRSRRSGIDGEFEGVARDRREW